MDFISSVWTWLCANINTIVMWFGWIVLIASIVVKTTPTKKDDSYMTKALNFILNAIKNVSIFNTKVDEKVLKEAREHVQSARHNLEDGDEE